ncbi:MAG: IS3 family transposase, partial [Shimia sp.]
MVEKGHSRLSVAAQCRLLSIPRSSFYHRPAGETAGNLALMQIIDRQFMETPFFGVRQMTWHLRNEGHPMNPKRVRRLMRPMGLMPIYRRPNTSKLAKGRQPFPYLLRGLTIDRPSLVRGYHVSPHATGISLPGGDHGLAQPPRAVLASFE